MKKGSKFLEFARKLPPLPTSLLAVSIDHMSARVTPAPHGGQDETEEAKEENMQLQEQSKG